MADTTKQVITGEWVKVADGACTVQSASDRDNYSKALFDVVIGGAKPADDTDVFIRMALSQHINFNHAAPVWLRLNASNADKEQTVIIVK